MCWIVWGGGVVETAVIDARLVAAVRLWHHVWGGIPRDVFPAEDAQVLHAPELCLAGFESPGTDVERRYVVGTCLVTAVEDMGTTVSTPDYVVVERTQGGRAQILGVDAMAALYVQQRRTEMSLHLWRKEGMHGAGA
jgi:hypothetical protein